MTENVNQNQKQSKQRQYESKIMQFMTMTQEVQLRKSQNKNLIRKNTLQGELKQIENDKLKDKNIKITNNEQQSIIKTQTSIKNNKTKQSLQSKILRSKQPSLLRRKTTLLTSHHNISLLESNPQHHPPTHQQLLQKIQTKIDIINQKISKQITNQQNQLLNEYEKKLRQKQQLLNKLKKTTNPQMIKEKTIERKQQLRREKESLIEGNMYYHEKMESVKGELDLLLESRDQGRQMLRMLVGGGMGVEGNNGNYQVDQNKITMKKQLAYFNSSNNNNQLQFVQKILSTYNQTNIFNQQQQSLRSIATDNNQSNTNITKQQHSRQLNESKLPRIPQRQKNISSVVLNKQSFDMDNDRNDFYSYRRVKNKFDRVRSTGMFGDNNGQTNNNSIDANMLQKLSLNKQKDSNKSNKQAKSSSINRRQRKKKQLFSNNSNNRKELANVNNNNNKSNNKNNNNTSNNLSYTKQYLQQFVVKKLSNQLNYQTKDKNNNKMRSYRQHKQQRNSINSNITNNNNINNNNNIKMKNHQQLIYQLQNKITQLQEQLTIQGLFKKTILQYYTYKQLIKTNHQQKTTTTTKKLAQNTNNNKLTTTINNVAQEEQQHQSQQQMTLLEKVQLMQEQEIYKDNNNNNDIVKLTDNDNNSKLQQLQQQLKSNVNNSNKQATQIINYNKAVVQLQSNEFDKRTIIDLLFSQIQFKQYLYQLIVQQFTSSQQEKMNKQQSNIKLVMDRFNQHRLLL